jgi:magnesium transporter
LVVDLLRRAAGGDAETIALLDAALQADPSAHRKALSELSSAEAGRLILRLRPRLARAVLRELPDAPSLAVLAEIDPAIGALLLDDDARARLAALVARLPLEEAADFLADAPASLIEPAVAAHPEAARLRAALGHRADTAGAVMRRRFVAVPADWTLGAVIEDIRRNSERIDKVYAVYVIDADGRLTGYLKLRDLLLLPPESLVAEVMRPDPVAVGADDDREAAIRLAAREHLPVLPVVDAERRILGMMTAEELLEIGRREAEEDMKIMAGLDPEATAADGPLTILRRRLPWLAGGLIGAGTAAVVVGAYEDALTEAAILASLIPIVMSLAGNAGIQASTVTVQAMTAGTLWIGDLAGRVLREFGGALLNGSAVGAITAAAILLLGPLAEIERSPALALTAFLTLVIVTVQASVVGGLIPIALERLKFDPAVATGVFITTSNDVVGVLIFFLIATTLYL